MYRDILFRGRRMDNGEWAQGSLLSFDYGGKTILPSAAKVFKQSGTTTICCNECHDVATETVGQYTGLTDRNGVKIFEGDVVHAITQNTSKNCCVKFEYGQFCIGINMPLAYVRNSCEVIGNIHDNPELLGGNDGTTDV